MWSEIRFSFLVFHWKSVCLVLEVSYSRRSSGKHLLVRSTPWCLSKPLLTCLLIYDIFLWYSFLIVTILFFRLGAGIVHVDHGVGWDFIVLFGLKYRTNVSVLGIWLESVLVWQDSTVCWTPFSYRSRVCYGCFVFNPHEACIPLYISPWAKFHQWKLKFPLPHSKWSSFPWICAPYEFSSLWINTWRIRRKMF